jgi:hypothetical protein
MPATDDQFDAFDRVISRDSHLAAWAIGAHSDSSTADLAEMFADLSSDDADRALLRANAR